MLEKGSGFLEDLLASLSQVFYGELSHFEV
jgi:hypothetical protein